jgi:hypothetical protein
MLLCLGLLGLAWGLGHAFWGSPALAVFGIVLGAWNLYGALWCHRRFVRDS